MTVFGKIADILGFGPNRWNERLGKFLGMISPEGNEFEAKWKKSDRSLEKRLGIFSYPKVVGNVVQDKAVNSPKHNYPFFFDGDNNDIDANDFFRAAAETGTWQVTHPVHGFFELQLVSVTEKAEPVDRGNITAFESVWIEPIDEVTLLSGREMAGIIDASVDELNVNAAQQFADRMKDGSETLRQNIEDATNLLDSITEKALSPLFDTVGALKSSHNAIQAGIQDTFRATTYKLESLAGQIQQLIQQSVLASVDLTSRLGAYSDLETGSIGSLSSTAGTSTGFAVNNAGIQELALSSVMISYANIATTSSFRSKAEAVSLIDAINSSFNTITNALDTAQADFSSNDVDEQYFSQTTTYQLLSKLVGEVSRYLLISAFDLKVEKRFILDKPTLPIDITINEYGSLGDGDSNFDLFISSNNLKGSDIILLPAGREVLIYV
jgi:hypothetical protein